MGNTALQTIEYNEHGGGLDQISSPTKTSEDSSTDNLNIDYSVDGSVFTRNGSTRLNSTQHNSGTRCLGLFDYKKSDGTQVEVIANGTTLATSLTSPSNSVTGLSVNLEIPDFEFVPTSDNEFLLWGNGNDANRKFNGTSWTNLSIARPTAPTGSTINAGSGSLTTGTYELYVSFARTEGSSNTIVQESELSPVGSHTIAAADSPANIRWTIPISSDSQVNARVLYRTFSGTTVRLTAGATVLNNTAATYDDSITNAGLTDTEAEFDNQAPPLSAVFEEFNGKVYYRDESNLTDFLTSKKYKPWNVPETSRTILDGKMTCMKRIFNLLVIGTNKSIWTVDTNENLRRISSRIGILNNRSFDGESVGYFVSTTRKVYKLERSDTNEDELILSFPISQKIEKELAKITGSAEGLLMLKYYSRANVAKVCILVPVTSTVNNKILIYNEQQTIRNMQLGKPSPEVWQIWDNLEINTLAMFTRNNVIQLIAGDYNGFYFYLDDPALNGDGEEDNGTATSGTVSALNDTSKSWTTNEHIGLPVRLIGGTGSGQRRIVSSNTSTQLVPTVNFNPAPDSTSIYSIGGFIHYHFTNWKYVLGSYKTLKQFWFLIPNMDVQGNYTITGILQSDFDESTANQTEISMNLASDTAQWGSVVWGSFVWGGRSVFENRFRMNLRFRALRVGVYHNRAGQPWKMNNFAISSQDHGLLF